MNKKVSTQKANLQVKILARFMNEKTLKLLIEDYDANLYHTKRSREVTPTDRKMLAEWKTGAPISEICTKFKSNRNAVIYAIAIASRE